MDIDKVKIGMLVTVNDLPDGQVYKVKEFSSTSKFGVRLTYIRRNTEYSGGWIDSSCLRKPTATQLANYERESK